MLRPYPNSQSKRSLLYSRFRLNRPVRFAVYIPVVEISKACPQAFDTVEKRYIAFGRQVPKIANALQIFKDLWQYPRLTKKPISKLAIQNGVYCMYLVSAPQFDEAHDDAAVVVLVNNLHQDLHRTVGGVFVVGVSGGIRQPDANSLLTDAQSQKKKKKKNSHACQKRTYAVRRSILSKHFYTRTYTRVRNCTLPDRPTHIVGMYLRFISTTPKRLKTTPLSGSEAHTPQYPHTRADTYMHTRPIRQ